MNYVLIGFMGSGKSTLGRYMAKKGYKLTDTDQYIEKKENRTVREIFDSEGEEYFRDKETAVIAEIAGRRTDGNVTAVGGGLPMREENRRYMHEAGKVVYLKASVDTLISRLSGDDSRPLLKGGDLRRKIEKLMSERGSTYEETADIEIDTDGLTVSEIFEILREKTV